MFWFCNGRIFPALACYNFLRLLGTVTPGSPAQISTEVIKETSREYLIFGHDHFRHCFGCAIYKFVVGLTQGHGFLGTIYPAVRIFPLPRNIRYCWKYSISFYCIDFLISGYSSIVIFIVFWSWEKSSSTKLKTLAFLSKCLVLSEARFQR